MYKNSSRGGRRGIFKNNFFVGDWESMAISWNYMSLFIPTQDFPVLSNLSVSSLKYNK